MVPGSNLNASSLMSLANGTVLPTLVTSGPGQTHLNVTALVQGASLAFAGPINTGHVVGVPLTACGGGLVLPIDQVLVPEQPTPAPTAGKTVKAPHMALAS